MLAPLRTEHYPNVIVVCQTTMWAWPAPATSYEYRLYTGIPADPCPPLLPDLGEVLDDIRATITTLNGATA